MKTERKRNEKKILKTEKKKLKTERKLKEKNIGN